MYPVIFKCVLIWSIAGLATGQTCTEPVDIVTVVDGSQSIGFISFATLLRNLVTFGDRLAVNDTGVKLGLVLYSTIVDVTRDIIPLTGNAESLKSAIQNLRYPEDGTNTHLGIQQATKMFNNDARPGVPRVMVVITDGISDSRSLTEAAAAAARKAKIIIYAVGVGLANVNDPGSELQAIATDSTNVLSAANFDELIDKLISLTQKICVNIVKPSGICDTCKMEEGVGYMPHEASCRKYIQCKEEMGAVTAIERSCGDRLFWKDSLQNCVEFTESDCYKSECSDGKTYLYESDTSCTAYFKCTNLYITNECCPLATPRFDAVRKECVVDPSSSCAPCGTQKLVPCLDGLYQPSIDASNVIDPCKYTVRVGPMVYTMDCPSGVIFDVSTCSCTTLSDTCTIPSGRAAGVCNADFYMPFDGDLTKDLSQHGSWVGRTGVSVSNGEATFVGNEKARLYVVRYSNNDFGLPVVFKVVYRDTAALSNMAVVSNGGCINKATVYITAGNGQVTLGAVTNGRGYSNPLTTSASTGSTNTWKEVKYLYDGYKLVGEFTILDGNLQPTSAPQSIPEVSVASGDVDRIMTIKGSLNVGYAFDPNFLGFQGTVSELKVWTGCTEMITPAEYS